MKGLGFKQISQRLNAEPAEQFTRYFVGLIPGINNCTKPSWVMQPQGAQTGNHVKVIVFARFGQINTKTDAA